MKTQCTPALPPFQLLKRRAVQVQFDGGFISSEGGALLLRELEQRTGILSRVSGCFTDYRNPDLIEHPVEALIKQRIYGVALGYEDLDDHDRLRHDLLLRTGRLAQRTKSPGLSPRSVNVGPRYVSWCGATVVSAGKT